MYGPDLKGQAKFQTLAWTGNNSVQEYYDLDHASFLTSSLTIEVDIKQAFAY